MELAFSKTVHLSRLHDALAFAVPDIAGALRLEGNDGWVQVILPDGVSRGAVDTIRAIVEHHNALAAYKLDRIQQIKSEARSLLTPTDWYVVCHAETGVPIPQAVFDYRAAIRPACDRAEQETAALDSVEAVRAYSVQWPGRPEGVL